MNDTQNGMGLNDIGKDMHLVTEPAYVYIYALNLFIRPECWCLDRKVRWPRRMPGESL